MTSDVNASESRVRRDLEKGRLPLPRPRTVAVVTVLAYALATGIWMAFPKVPPSELPSAWFLLWIIALIVGAAGVCLIVVALFQRVGRSTGPDNLL